MGIKGIENLYPDQEENKVADTQPNYDDEDVKAALAKTDTQDGPGFDNEDDLPESDFEGFSEEGVENDHDGDNAGDAEVSQ